MSVAGVGGLLDRLIHDCRLSGVGVSHFIDDRQASVMQFSRSDANESHRGVEAEDLHGG